ncbi:MAG: YgjP-like metallopeptidase domain-containing protein [Gammaproteobacteria bacterium]
MENLAWPDAFLPNETVPYSGYRWCVSVKYAASHQIFLQNGCLQVTLALELPISDYAVTLKTLILDWLKAQAHHAVQAKIRSYSEKMGRAPRRFALKATKSRWGSLGIHDDLYINWVLILGPAFVLEYVVVHEMSHLFYRSHGPRFWGVVQKWMPEYRQAEKWLRAHGLTLLKNLTS